MLECSVVGGRSLCCYDFRSKALFRLGLRVGVKAFKFDSFNELGSSYRKLCGRTPSLFKTEDVS